MIKIVYVSLRLPLRHPRVSNMPGISQMNKAQLVAEIQTLGGTADLSTRKMELQQQLYGLYEENGVVANTTRAITDYQNYTRAMNKAGKYKKDLIQYMEEHLNLPVNPNATQIQLQKQALLKIYSLSKIDETDPVGFGIHSSLTYRELKETQAAYCQWAVTTAREGQCNPLMERFVTWLEREKTEVKDGEPKTRPKAKTRSTMMSGRRDKTDEDETSLPSQSSSQMPTQMMAEMMGALKSLQQEVNAMKEDSRSSRPRRENHPDQEMAAVPSASEDGSFVAVSGYKGK